MSAADLSSQVLDQFRDVGLETHTTILLGAGASMGSGLADWDTLAIRLLTESGSVLDENAAQLLLANQDPLLVVEAARARMPDQQAWEVCLQHALYGKDPAPEALGPSPLHLAAAGYHLAGGPTDSRLVTLNFDTLLETAIDLDTDQEAYSSTRGNGADHGHVVHHLHGLVTQDSVRDVVLTLNDFTDLVADKEAWQPIYLEDCVTRGALVIAGTSYRDPDLRQWLRIALRKKPNAHEALVLLAREAFGMSKNEFASLENALSDQWRAVGLKPILLQDHADAAQILRELRHLNSPTYMTPQQRALAVMAAHTAQFDHFQASYAARLSEDAAMLGDALGIAKFNVSLWLADGRGKLTRWASQDRIYRSADAIHGVRTGHDSPWIAGQALGADAMLLEQLEPHETGQWQSVLAVPIVVPHPDLPAATLAILTVGSPQTAEEFSAAEVKWGPVIAEIAENWSEQLAAATFQA